MLFFIAITADSYVFARVRLVTGSVWPAVLLHSAWNSVIQGSFDAFVPGYDGSFAGNIWVGESGILVAACSVGFALVLTAVPVCVKRSVTEAHPPEQRLIAW